MTSPSLDTASFGKSKRRFHGLLIVLLACIITLAAVVANVALRRAVEEVRRTEVQLLQFQGLAYRLSAIEWQAISEQEMSAKIVARVQDIQDEMKRTMGSLEQLDPNWGDLRSVRQAYDAYVLAMNEEFSLIKAGDLNQAHLIDEELVDPAFDALTQALTSTGAAHRTQAKQMEQLAFYGSLLILLLAIVTIGALVWQTQKARAATEAAAVEQRTLTRDHAELCLFADNVPSMTASFDENLRCVFANKRYADFFDLDREEITGKHLREILGEKVYNEVEIHFALVLQGGSITYQRTFELQAGKSRYLEVRLVPDIRHQGKVLGCFAVAHDITERKETEGRIVHLNRVYAMLSRVNSLVVRIRESQELLEEACRIAVEQGNFGIAWIGSFDPATLDVTPIAWAGLDAEGYLSNIKSTVRGDLPQGQGAVGRAIRELRPVFNNDISAETGVGSVRRAEALRRGYRSVIVLPLFVDGTVKAIFSMFAKELNYFNDEEVSLLTELAGNISFALDHMARQKKIEKLSRIRSVLGNINAAIVRIHDKQRLLEEACHIAAEQGRLGAVWIGSLDPATLDITPVAWAGVDSETIRTTKSTARDAPPRGQGPVSRAARERRAVFNNDLFLQSFGSPRRDAVLKLGFRSMIALPLLEGDKVVGTFTLYAREPGFFDPDEIALLTEMAGNVSFALEHMAHQQRIEKLSRVRAVSSEVNAAIVRSRTRQILFYEACRIAIEHGRFGIAWIGEFDPEKQEVLPVATAGLEDSDFIMHTVLSIRADSAQGAGVLPRAVRDRRPVFSNDITVDADIGGERRKEAIRRGYRSVIVLPLIVDGAVEATFSMFAKERNYFDDEEVGLLTELAGNISLALEHMARQEKIEKLSRIRAISSEINVAIVRIHERHALLKEACRIASEHGKFEMVWIGSIDHEKQEVRPVTWAGFSPETAHSVSWASVNAATGTVGEALRDRKPAVRNDIESQVSAGGKLRGEALERGCRSSVCLPLVVSDIVTTFIVLFATGRGFFNKDELALLDEVASNISFALEAIERQEKFDYLSYYDPLTGLPNRTLFMDRVSQQLRVRAGEPRMVALILLNIERFRYINESLGRHGGDALLNLVAQRLEAAFHGKDFLARISADSFGVVIRGIQDAKAALHAVQNQAFGCFRDPYRVNDSELRVAAKAGIAMFPADGADADTLFKNAEAALKKARDSSERYLFYAADMNERAAHILSMETRMRKAVEAQQFVLHYQPKIELANDKICGLEALIRWQDPESGLVAPGTFIPLLEETGLILDVGKWALGQALADHREWTARGCAVPRIAVNVSAVQLQQKDFADMVVGVVQQHGDHPDALELEVTESLLMKDVQESIRKLSLLRGLGIHIAMDDFGTGHSSLSYLARLPLNSLKIDRSFITEMANSPQDMSIVTTIIALAHSLNLRVVAEGVETESQSKLLQLLKCDEAQGYLFSKPLPASEIELLLRAPA